jgi:hypothetical protein
MEITPSAERAMYELYLASLTTGLRRIFLCCRAGILAVADVAWHSQSLSERAMPAARDIRLDFFRGLALWFIFLDHIPGNIASWLTVRNYGFSDATEIFVFISGYTAALVYSDAMRKDGLIQSGARIIRRAWQIYVGHIFSFAVYAATIAYTANTTGNPFYIDGFGLTDFFRQPDFMFPQVLLLRFKPVNMDVLPMYIGVLVAFPPTLWVLVRKPGLALAGSVALYVLARSNGWEIVSHTGDAWQFNPLAWQLLFVFGAWCALGGARRLAGLIGSRPVGLAAVGYLAFALVIAMTWHVPVLAELVPAWLSQAIYPIDKPNLDMLRIVHFLALTVLTVRLMGRDSPVLASPVLRPVVRCGMYSLEVFCAGVFASFVAHAVLVQTSGGAAAQVVVSAAGISLLVAVAGLIGWYRSIAEKKRALRSTGNEGLVQPVQMAPATA